jgi:hypothetical protein
MTTNNVGPTSILGLPHHLQCAAEAFSFPRGAREPGSDISQIDYNFPDRFLMTLQQFYADSPVSGLLMWDCSDAGPMRTSRTPIPPPREHRWFFFGYLCERCQQTFLLPYWASSADDLPRAVRHRCFGGMDIDEVPRGGIRQLASEVAVQVLNQIHLRSPQVIDKTGGDYLGHLLAHRLENALESFWQQMATMATEKAQGRG